MAAVRCSTLEYFPENVLIDILSYLNVRELVRNSRVCRRWKQLVKDQRLWRAVDLSTWKGLTSRVLWVLLRQYLGHGLRRLRLRGLLLSARRGAFLTESWLQTLCSKCPRLCRLCLQHTDLRRLRSCSLLPSSLQVLELSSCEVPAGFFAQDPETDGKAGIETLIVENVPSFSDQHLRSLCSWRRLRRLELRDLIRVSAGGLGSCADARPPHAAAAGDLEPDADGGAGAGPGLAGAGETLSGRERGQPGSAVCQPSAGSALAASAQVQTEPEDGAQMLQVSDAAACAGVQRGGVCGG
ncbi:hypothetical protein G5714_013913 [Onychostoma macrolepis]|uniref:F-box domain-containing protein n=1 Tax=Onychostoma macrolepis TaxID=369639 RepID=A0A7J6CFJ1_9TELE|nr:hypothetical protein G5714_013913 [Onychostoma macrolepis]